MKPTKLDISRAVERMSLLRFFPGSEGAQAEIMRLLERLVSTKPQLDWLVTTMIDRVGEWKGPTELRGVLCSRFTPADGIEMDCRDTFGFRPVDFEERSLLGHEQLKALPAAEKPGTLALVKQLQSVKKC